MLLCITLLHCAEYYCLCYIVLLLQSTVVPRAEIDRAYDSLFHEAESFLTELRSRQEQQRIEEEEAAKLKKLREEQVWLIRTQDTSVRVVRIETHGLYNQDVCFSLSQFHP